MREGTDDCRPSGDDRLQASYPGCVEASWLSGPRAAASYGSRFNKLLPQSATTLFDSLELRLEELHFLLQSLYASVFSLEDGSKGGTAWHATRHGDAAAQDGARDTGSAVAKVPANSTTGYWSTG